MAKKKIPQKVKQQVKQRAKGYYEYCIYPEAYACQCFNGHKYNKTHATNPINGKWTSLFNPRRDKWSKHFCWSDDYMRIEGLSAIGRATIKLLDLNRDSLLRLRAVLFAFGEHPPK